ncbi:C40 family peptidase [Nocardiopsis baichengensis]|uniref:C40 family peptidase n=1 Tax=Nocardiopsis baichengensis TaxID=280240 RepID=UPI00034CFC5D|nr:NlpC/P60 family protein [Nocardiopsis baichengensis]
MLKAALAGVAGVLSLPVVITAIAAGAAGSGGAPASVDGIHPVLLDAYTRAANGFSESHPECTGLTWAHIAGIAKVESDHAYGRDIGPDGDVAPPVIGPRLDGSGNGGNLTPHYDTDGGKWDRDTEYDRAVGITQHLPANWARYGRDGNNDDKADPHNAYDATLSTAVELCTSGPGGVDFTDRAQLEDALFRYNPATWYVEEVMAEIDRYTAMGIPAVGVAGGGSEQGRAAAEWALAQVGKPYAWGGTGPNAFDCSGLTMKAWAHAGADIGRVTTQQYRNGEAVSLDELEPGDLLFYKTDAPGPPPTHVTMYVGDGQMVNAPRTGKDIRVEPVASGYYSPRFMGARRP